MTGDTLTLRFAGAATGDGRSARPDEARPTAADLGRFCRQLDIAYRLLWDTEADPPADADSTAFASAVAAGGGLSVTPRADLPVALRVRRVTTDWGLSLSLAGDPVTTRRVARLCGWTPAPPSGDDGVTLESLEQAQTSLAAGIGELKSGLGTADDE